MTATASKSKIPDTVPAKVIASFTGLTRQRLAQMAEETKIPAPLGRGAFKFRETILAVIEDLRQRAKGAHPGIAEDKARMAKAEADTAELSAAEKAGSLILREDVELIWMDGALEVRRVIEDSDYLKPAQKSRLISALAKISLAESPRAHESGGAK